MSAFTGKLVRTVLTAVNKDAAQKSTVLTIDFTGITPASAMAYMARSITIDEQRTWRKNGIPATATVKAVDKVPGGRAAEPVTVESEAARASALSAEDLKKLVAELQAKLKA